MQPTDSFFLTLFLMHPKESARKVEVQEENRILYYKICTLLAMINLIR